MVELPDYLHDMFDPDRSKITNENGPMSIAPPFTVIPLATRIFPVTERLASWEVVKTISREE